MPCQPSKHSSLTEVIVYRTAGRINWGGLLGNCGNWRNIERQISHRPLGSLQTSRRGRHMKKWKALKCVNNPAGQQKSITTRQRTSTCQTLGVALGAQEERVFPVWRSRESFVWVEFKLEKVAWKKRQGVLRGCDFFFSFILRVMRCLWRIFK